MNLPDWILTLITLLSITITFGCIAIAYRSWSYAKKAQTMEDPLQEEFWSPRVPRSPGRSRSAIRLEVPPRRNRRNRLLEIEPIARTYRHPSPPLLKPTFYNEYLFDQKEPVTITLLIRADSLEERVKISYEKLGDRQIPLKIFGQIFLPIDRKANKWDLQIDPLAIY